MVFYSDPAVLSIQIDPDKISVSQEYLHGLRVALETERRRVEELETEVCRLNKELAACKVKPPQTFGYLATPCIPDFPLVLPVVAVVPLFPASQSPDSMFVGVFSFLFCFFGVPCVTVAAHAYSTRPSCLPNGATEKRSSQSVIFAFSARLC